MNGRQTLLGGLDLIPVAQHRRRGALDRGIDMGSVAGRSRGLVAKDVGMAADQLVVQALQHIRDGEMALVGRHLGIKQHLKQQIAQLLGQVRKVAALDGVEDLIGFFQRVFSNGVKGLLAVPGAAAGGAQPGHDRGRLLKQGSRPRRVGRCLRRGSLCVGAFWRKVHAPSVYLA